MNPFKELPRLVALALPPRPTIKPVKIALLPPKNNNDLTSIFPAPLYYQSITCEV